MSATTEPVTGSTNEQPADPAAGPAADQVTSRHDRRRVGLLAVVLAAVASVAVIGPIAVIAWSDRGSASFGDQETIGRNRIGAATLAIEVGERTVPLRADRLAPGDAVLGEIELVNAGTVPVRYAVTVSAVADDGLGSWLTWWFLAVPADEECPSEARWRAGVEGAARIAGDRVSPTGTAVVGDVAPGPDDGDRILDVDATERWCVAVFVAIDAPNSAQRSTAEARVTAHAEQLTSADTGDRLETAPAAATVPDGGAP